MNEIIKKYHNFHKYGNLVSTSIPNLINELSKKYKKNKIVNFFHLYELSLFRL